MSPEAELAKDRRAGIPQMQHRHFAFIAQIIANTKPEVRSYIANFFADHLRSTNPGFHRGRFLTASGLDQIELDKVAKEYEEILAIQK